MQDLCHAARYIRMSSNPTGDFLGMYIIMCFFIIFCVLFVLIFLCVFLVVVGLYCIFLT